MFGLQSLFSRDFLKVVTLEDLAYVNNQLISRGLPVLFRGINLQGEKVLNPSYKIKPIPRFVWDWSTFRLRISEAYLRPFAVKGEFNYSIFVNTFYSDVPTDQLPDVIDGPEIKIVIPG